MPDICPVCKVYEGHLRTCSTQLQTRAQRVRFATTATMESCERAGLTLAEIRDGRRLAAHEEELRLIGSRIYGSVESGGWPDDAMVHLRREFNRPRDWPLGYLSEPLEEST